jgi:hypothetical protein
MYQAREERSGQCSRLAQYAIPRKEFPRYEATACQLQVHAKYCICVNQHVHIHSLFLRTATDFPSQDHTTTQDSLNELRKVIEGTKEDLEDQLDQVRHAISGAGASLRDFLQADQEQLQSGLESLAQAQRVAETAQPQVVITRNLGGQESSTLFGTDTSRPQFRLTVSDNEAQQGAVMAAGVYSLETLQALLRGSRTADLVLVPQALHNQPQSTSGTTLQSILNGVATGRTHGLTDGPSTMNAAPKLSISDQEETPGALKYLDGSTQCTTTLAIMTKLFDETPITTTY